MPYKLSGVLSFALTKGSKLCTQGSHVTVPKIQDRLTAKSLQQFARRGLGTSTLKDLQILDISDSRIQARTFAQDSGPGSIDKSGKRGSRGKSFGDYLETLLDRTDFKYFNIASRSVYKEALSPFLNTPPEAPLQKIIWIPKASVDALEWANIACNTDRLKIPGDPLSGFLHADKEHKIDLLEKLMRAHLAYTE